MAKDVLTSLLTPSEVLRTVDPATLVRPLKEALEELRGLTYRVPTDSELNALAEAVAKKMSYRVG